MGQPVVHFEIIGTDPAELRRCYSELFGWEFDTGNATTEAVSQPGHYGFVDGSTTGGARASTAASAVARSTSPGPVLRERCRVEDPVPAQFFVRDPEGGSRWD